MKILSMDYHLSQAGYLKEVEHPNKMQIDTIKYAGYNKFWVEPNSIREMASIAAYKALSITGIQTKDIGFIVAGQSGVPDYIGIDLACQVGAELQCSDIRTVNLVEGCGSGISVWFQAMSLTNMLPSGKVGLVVVAQRVSDAHQDRFGVMNAALSDGAAVAIVACDDWVTSSPTLCYLAGDDMSDCCYVDMMRVEHGGACQPVLPEGYDARHDKLGRERIMDIYQFTPDDLKAFLTLRADNIVKIIKRVITKVGRPLNSPFLLQTLEGTQSIKDLCKKMDIAPERSNLSLLPELGHVGCTDLLISLKMLIDKGDIQPGDDIIMSTISTGLKWGAAIFQYNSVQT
ncbi:3-oxoacyl-[acyl-carrier-protein] synthase III C-terminal domain-containing protein [Xenorhabdus sp. SF857]|uniref:3-oxoacyl-[acyl-carrier-protein] synthase III C-terminal domain-containing protein n=1 Tax=Xenorhabdus bakwenae TaxID=3026967 RepID=UPI002557D6C2|nr:3-oxoacyl-[acyl-carrier-protein] synthase III C-terminal domain-containing protein [Xenorhabdus sp. SF857]WFQ79987.1 3-oxoacyl-[acyl-carrier-protein] synthase III C-terminal domain-containing protein [Xenorhabdus sp. SF857]